MKGADAGIPKSYVNTCHPVRSIAAPDMNTGYACPPYIHWPGAMPAHKLRIMSFFHSVP